MIDRKRDKNKQEKQIRESLEVVIIIMSSPIYHKHPEESMEKAKPPIQKERRNRRAQKLKRTAEDIQRWAG